ncbi:MAG TPA: hypothetical protein VMD09_08420 [Solirubrobacteraceae bacterium]|nr:hypothetical protein [Solirubrobacteraceae bacterium]
MAKATLLHRAGRGLVAGVFGTATMTAWQELSAKLQSSEGAGSQGESDPWAQAPAPAKVGRLLLGALGYEVPADKIDLLTNVMHWGYGTTWGAVYGAVMGNAADRRPLARGLGFGTCVWLMSYAQLVPLGIYQPPWKYPPQELALDLSYHLAYGAGVGAAGALVEP